MHYQDTCIRRTDVIEKAGMQKIIPISKNITKLIHTEPFPLSSSIYRPRHDITAQYFIFPSKMYLLPQYKRNDIIIYLSAF